MIIIISRNSLIVITSYDFVLFFSLKEKDEYDNEVIQLARPLPIEYLLVDVPVSTPMEPQFTFFTDPKITAFPVENRMVDGHIQVLDLKCLLI